MTLFLLGYAVGLKEKIKTVMRTLLAGVSVFILYTTATGTTHAQLIYLEDRTTPPVLSYLNKFLYMQPKWSTSPAYSAGNKAFFQGFRDQINDLPAEDHLTTVEYTLNKLEKMSTQSVKVTYNLDKHIALAILKGIHEMSQKDGATRSSTSSYSVGSSSSTSSQHNNVYEKEIKEFQGKTYYIYTLQTDINIKHADFHNEHGSFYSCMYNQCNKIAFESSKNPGKVSITFSNGVQETIMLDGTYKAEKKSVSTEIKDDNRTITSSTDNTITVGNTQEDVGEEDLLEELSNLFGDLL